MKELNFDTGLQTYKVNGKCEITFNPADVAFVKRLFGAFDDLTKKQEDTQSAARERDDAELFDIAEQRDKEMRQRIDDLFGEPICDKVFGDQSVYALAGGLPLWCNFLMAVIDEVDASVVSQQKMTNPRVDHYLAKYAKYRKR